jgi:NADH dehydrogenase
MNTQTNKKILILGAGFAGLAASKELEGFGEVTVIDPSPSFEFAPNIHELISGFKSPSDVRLDNQKILSGRGQTFIQEAAVGLDIENKTVITSTGTHHHYDCLVLAIGGVSNDRGVPGVDEHAFPFKSASECHAIGQKLEYLENQGLPYSVTIVGGGVEGVESLGEILRKYNGSTNLSVNLVEGASQLLQGTSRKVHQEILEICKDFSVAFHFEEKVNEVEAHQVTLSSGESLHSDLTIWTGGVKSHPQFKAWGLEPEVNRFLQSQKHPEILIIGDAVDVMGGGEKQAYLAIEMGELAGNNVRSILRGEQLKPYKPQKYPSIYSFGNLSCFVIYEGFSLSGLPFSGLKEAIYQLNMASIQGVPMDPEQLTDILGRGSNGALGALYSIIKSPIPLLSRFGIGFSLPTDFLKC